MSKEHPAPTRLLLPAAFTIAAGIGLALAYADDAQAADRNPPALEQITQPATPTVARNLPEHPAAADAVNRPVRADRKIASQARGTVDKTVRYTTRTVKQVTDAVDAVTSALPLVGKTVDGATDRTDTIVDTAPAIVDPFQLLRPGGLGGAASADTGLRATPPSAAAPIADAPQTAPGPAREHPPLVAAGPGVHLSCSYHSGAPPAGPQGTRVAETAPGPGDPQGPASWCVHSLGKTGGSPSHSHPLLPAGRWSTIPSWQHAIMTYIADRDGRTEPPSPPSG